MKNSAFANDETSKTCSIYIYNLNDKWFTYRRYIAALRAADDKYEAKLMVKW